MSVLTVILMLAAVMALAYLGFPIFIVFLLCSIGVMAGTGMPIVPGLQESFMGGAADFFQKFFLIFFFGSLLASILQHSGGAESIAKKILEVIGEKYVIIGIVIATAVLVYGGISVFVVMFAIVPMALPMLKKANIPRYLLPGILMAGLGTFAMTSPGTPQIQNIIPMKYLDTPATAALGPGLITGLVIAILVTAYMQWQKIRAKSKGESYTSSAFDEAAASVEEGKLPHWLIGLLPLLVVVLLLNLFKLSPEVSLGLGVLAALALLFRNIGSMEKLFGALNEGSKNAVLVIMSTSMAVGFGTTVADSAAYPVISDWVSNLGGNPLIASTLSTTVLCGVTGSASGGLGIAAPIMADQFLGQVNPESLHRIMSVASGGLDSLPHNGFVIAMLSYLGLTHKESYKEIFVVSAIIPLICCFVFLIPLLMLWN